MRITKRQLKRIIREEYSRLKRRGLIREAMKGGRWVDNEDAAGRWHDSPDYEGSGSGGRGGAKWKVGGSQDDIAAYQEVILDVLERFEFGAPFETFAATVQRDLGRYDMRNMHAAIEELVESGELVGPDGPAKFYRLPE